ncbi:hypothetical protein LTR53_003746 [Teratosphaeriaceae sp. CCFEE 6253]|nr:hypothetical protein LTR53_003746 [Teratosphaeriaceae sp. CCFEE 6253]
MAPFEDNAPKIVGTVATLVFLGSIVFPLRIHVRASNHALGWDDWWMMIALVPWAALSAVCIASAFHGVGIGEDKLTLEERQEALMWFWLFEIFWCLAVIPVKLSISFMLGRIAVAHRPLIIGLYVMSALFTTLTLLGFFYIIFRCTPISYAWDTTTPSGKCQPEHILAGIYYAITAINIAIDWYCALLPIPLLWNAPLDLRTKLSVAFLLSLGVLASIAACVRQKYTSALTSENDLELSLGMLMIWGYAEVGIGFFVGSLSTLPAALFSPLGWPGASPIRTSRTPRDTRGASEVRIGAVCHE